MFTERFLEVPVKVVDRKQRDMFGEDKAEKSSVRGKINPFEITEYREDDFDDGVGTIITFKNGVEMVVELSMDEFEEILNKHAV